MKKPWYVFAVIFLFILFNSCKRHKPLLSDDRVSGLPNFKGRIVYSETTIINKKDTLRALISYSFTDTLVTTIYLPLGVGKSKKTISKLSLPSGQSNLLIEDGNSLKEMQLPHIKKSLNEIEVKQKEKDTIRILGHLCKKVIAVQKNKYLNNVLSTEYDLYVSDIYFNTKSNHLPFSEIVNNEIKWIPLKSTTYVKSSVIDIEKTLIADSIIYLPK